MATDYDGTLADEGLVAEETLRALENAKAAGKKLILATGRQIPDLRRVFPEVVIFDLVVAENGALLWEPSTDTATLLCNRPPETLVAELKAQKVEPLYVGEVVVATLHSNAHLVRGVIDRLGIDFALTFNKGSVMVLPKDVDKGTGAAAALSRLKVHPGMAVGVGDAENDEALLRLCGYRIAVANAVTKLKTSADFVTNRPDGKGVVELIDLWLARGLECP